MALLLYFYTLGSEKNMETKVIPLSKKLFGEKIHHHEFLDHPTEGSMDEPKRYIFYD